MVGERKREKSAGGKKKKKRELILPTLTRLRPAAPELTAGPVISLALVVVVVAVAAVAGSSLRAAPEVEVWDEELPLRGL